MDVALELELLGSKINACWNVSSEVGRRNKGGEWKILKEELDQSLILTRPPLIGHNDYTHVGSQIGCRND